MALSTIGIAQETTTSAAESAKTPAPESANTQTATTNASAAKPVAKPKPEEKDQLSLDGGTIDSQFDYVIQKSNKYEEYKVVKSVWLNKLKSHTIDTLNGVKSQLSQTQLKITEQQNEIDGLKGKLQATQKELKQTIEEKDSMAFFGVLMSKGGYNGMIFSIIGILIVLLAYFIYRFKNSNAVTKEAKIALQEMEAEFDEHRKRALEREQKVMRQLQDEINKKKKATKK